VDTQATSLVNAWLGLPATTTSPPTYLSYQPGVGPLAANSGVTSNDSTVWTTAEKAQPVGFLHVALSALTQGAMISASVSLAQNIESQLLPANATVKDLKAISVSQWTTFFQAHPDWIPSFVQPGNTGPSSTSQTGVPAGSKPGYIAACIKHFVRAVQRFFTVSSAAIMPSLPNSGTPPVFGPPSFDAIEATVGQLPTGFTFGKGPLTPAQIAAAAQNVFSPGTNAAAEAWLEQAIATINELYQIVSVVAEITPNETPPASLRFCIMEALYARGFTSAADITRLSPNDFRQALTGAVAYNYASSLHGAAAGIAKPATPGTPPAGGFKPINPDGELTDCLPPPCISPLGPVAYLQELLQLHQDATCEPRPPGSQPDQSPTLISVISGRRGPLDTLLASGANVAIKLPLIDIVNECLENAAATAPKTVVGAVYHTTSPTPAGYKFCGDGPGEGDDADCHSAEQLLDAVPEWSSPAVPVQQPQAYVNLANDFSSQCLPYSQPLDISRAYQRLLCAYRADTMRRFRKEITEFVLAPDTPPSGFQDYLWRYPIPIDIAVEYLGLTPQEFSTLFAGNGTLPPNLPPWQLYGFSSAGGNGDSQSWLTVVAEVAQFLERICLSYCEFLELQSCGFVAFRNADRTARRQIPRLRAVLPRQPDHQFRG
jgi:hypothetical protein